tara:strand:+ start:4040 stop:4354 length:315 start_codon:yes stop_codon:yes gene_type:complete
MLYWKEITQNNFKIKIETLDLKEYKQVIVRITTQDSEYDNKISHINEFVVPMEQVANVIAKAKKATAKAEPVAEPKLTEAEESILIKVAKSIESVTGQKKGPGF